MVQVLDAVPSFGSQLGRGLGQGIGNFAKGLTQGKIEKNKLEREKEFRKEADETLFKNYGIQLSGIRDPKERQTVIAESLKGQRKQIELNEKKQQEEAEKLKEQEEFKEVLTGIEELIPYAGAPIGKAFFANFPWSKAAEKREQMDVLAFQLERYARAAHTKGALSTKVYQSLLSKLPDSHLSEAKNKGRLKAWKDVLLGFDKEQISNKTKRPDLNSFYE